MAADLNYQIAWIIGRNPWRHEFISTVRCASLHGIMLNRSFRKVCKCKGSRSRGRANRGAENSKRGSQKCQVTRRSLER